MLTPLLVPPQSPSVVQSREAVVVDNGQVALRLERKSGRFDLVWKDAAAVRSAYGEATLTKGGLHTTTAYARHDLSVRTVRDAFGNGVEVTLRHRTPGEPELRHLFWIYSGRAEALVRLDVVGSTGSNNVAPVVTERVEAPKGSAQSLFVPYDNDAYVRYRSDGWTDASHEVGAVYNDITRRGLVVGSIDHGLWKSGVRFTREGGLRAFGGMTSKDTRDKEPHGTVVGREIHSPRMLLGAYSDWRVGMERYGDANALVKPALPWGSTVPFGWNSWAAHKEKLTAANGRAATDFIQNELPQFRSGGTAYVNFDSFWDNLKKEERIAFVHRAHAAGLKAGTYWTPFVAWGDLSSRVGIGDYRYRDLALKDSKGNPLPKLDGGWPLDPTHPGTLARIDRQLKEFVDHGFDFVKLDFMTHGALEGQHSDPKVTTGTAAYTVGMSRVVDQLSAKRIGRPFFISLSIAPLFPQGFAHSRRVSCDVFANIGASEYLLNSSAYGWWTADRLYRFNDPDHTVVYRPLGDPPTTEAEARTRFVASVISGGMLLQGDDLGDPAAGERVKRLFSNREVLDLARMAPAFRPVDGATGERAGDAFVWTHGEDTYVSVFNFDKTTKRRAIALSRIGLTGSLTVHDVLNGAERTVNGDLAFELAATDCALVRLRRAR